MRWAGWWLGPLLGIVSAYAVYVLLREIWGACRVGINASARGFSLVFLEMPRTFAIVAVVAGVVYALLRRVPVKWRTSLAIVGAVLVAIAVVWITVSIQHYPYDDGSDCVPPWWPHWIPL